MEWWFPFWKVWRSGRTGSRRDWEEGKGELLVNGCRVLVLQDEKALEMDGGDGGTTL